MARQRTNDEDMVPLMIEKDVPESTNGDHHSTISSEGSIGRKFFVPIVVIAFLVAGFFMLEQDATTTDKAQDVKNKNLAPADMSAMIDSFNTGKQALIEKLKVDYGAENFENIFMEKSDNDGKTTSRFRSVFTQKEGSSSLDRMKRKAMMKLLQVSLKGSPTTAVQAEMVPFVWATGGHSATAAHGNFFDESYTAALEKAAKPVMETIGIDFVGRNYAMGGTASGSEIAFCVKEIFGQDIDTLSWDFGMTDGREYQKQLLYLWRAGYVKSRPAVFTYHVGGSHDAARWTVTNLLDQHGLTALQSSEAVLDAALAAIPDSQGKSEEEIKEMPPFVRNFRCGKGIEAGDPYCQAEKFNLTMCEGRRFRTSWHPGWRWHAVMGYLIAFFLFEIFEDAMKEIAASTSLPATLLAELKQREEADYAKFFEAEVPFDYFNKYLAEEDRSKVDWNILAKENNICHTGRVPAEIRYRGILTESDKKGSVSVNASRVIFNYDEGITLEEANALTSTDSMPLVYEPGIDGRDACPVIQHVDFKDWFAVHQKYGPTNIVLPNDLEAKEYLNGQPLKGAIVACMNGCDWGKCPQGFLQPQDYNATKFSMNVNGEPVTELPMMQDCFAFMNKDGMLFKPNAEGKFVISATVFEEGSYLRFSTFIIW